ncbi:hypothetical protein DLJ47_25500 [Micromonospora sp. S4605]|uniref:hypothetical protein n=1 Tax=Micromonospora sp. S4605 TaxID=1420897 RepID=UPI000D6F3D9A|nr:hypothetical protein [Micromonospora sp. S4605]PWU49748.1 hypothetical protein DLJ47_25500 [Micromonospora sp. S4605]
MDRTSAQWVGRVGTAAAAVGAAILLLHLATKALDAELRLTGALLVVGGLVLRAVTGGGRGTGRMPGRTG